MEGWKPGRLVGGRSDGRTGGGRTCGARGIEQEEALSRAAPPPHCPPAIHYLHYRESRPSRRLAVSPSHSSVSSLIRLTQALAHWLAWPARPPGFPGSLTHSFTDHSPLTTRPPPPPNPKASCRRHHAIGAPCPNCPMDLPDQCRLLCPAVLLLATSCL